MTANSRTSRPIAGAMNAPRRGPLVYARPVRSAARAMILCLSVLLASCGGDDDGDGGGGDVDGGGGDVDVDAGGGGPETACCDLDERPGEGGTLPCIEGATCCADGTWRCNEGDGSSTCDTAGGDCTGVACDETAADQCLAPAG